VCYAPFIVLTLLNHFSDYVIPWERIAHKNVAVFLLAVALILLTFFSQMIAHSVVRAVTIPVVLQSIIAPLRPVRIGTAFDALKRRWRVFTIASLLVLFSSIFGMILFIIPGVTIMTIFALYAPVVMMEDLGVRATLKRSYRLMTRSKGAVVIITLLQFALPFLLYRTQFSVSHKANTNANFSLGSSGDLAQLWIVLITPLTAIMVSLLYLKAREAGGEGVKDTMEHLYAHEMPTSKWEKKMSTGTKL